MTSFMQGTKDLEEHSPTKPKQKPPNSKPAPRQPGPTDFQVTAPKGTDSLEPASSVDH
jgi:hypothetical protein